jgi:hypothetical protein
MIVPRRAIGMPRRCAGAVAVSFVFIVPVIIGFIGLAIDLSMLYARKAELQEMADSVAMAAAFELNGTATGVDNASFSAEEVAGGSLFQFSNVRFRRRDHTWNGAALLLAASPDGPWQRADSSPDPTGLMYAKVDTAALDTPDNPDSSPLVVPTSFMRVLGAPASMTLAPVAVAGRQATRITPLAVCALDANPVGARALFSTPPTSTTELVELGFRRGVTYDLLQLNPVTSTAQNFLLDPVADASRPYAAKNFDAGNIKPFFCAGKIAYAGFRVGGRVHVKPRTVAVHEWLNSRFGDYSGDGCVAAGAPPDTNVKQFLPPYSWMPTPLTTPPTVQLSSAQKNYIVTAGSTATKLVTSADVTVKPGTTNYKDDVTAIGFGPLWVYTKPVKSGTKPPVAFAATGTDWGKLYPVSTGGALAVSGYPTKVPYLNDITAPAAGGVAERRVLNLALLDCSEDPVPSSAKVLGIGRFFMTSKATASAVYGEFAGLAAPDSLAASVALLK